jgi:hypothetical protein
MDICPKCKRNLLSHSSARCNWCGEVITDPDYVQEAEANRDAYYQHDRLEAAIEVARIDAISPIFGTGIGGGVIPGAPGPFGYPGYVPSVPKVPNLPMKRRVNKVTQDGEYAPPAPEQELTQEPESLEQDAKDRASHIEF